MVTPSLHEAHGGLFSFSLMTTLTRSRLLSMVLGVHLRRMGLFRGMAFL